MSTNTPIEDVIRAKITAALNPQILEIYNDSHRHAHHEPMRESTSKETHFRLVIISEAFRSKMQAARHRMVYALLTEEMAREGGIHALQLRTLTPEEQAIQEKKQQTLSEKSEKLEKLEKIEKIEKIEKKDQQPSQEAESVAPAPQQTAAATAPVIEPVAVEEPLKA
ncbi:bola-like protein-domain-containing protein [Stachybotrys elegans]|uniref:Bola-like protein-domain-containing protein n=1 Tax=Stachybotrys elegans TaxID=80388 RepID=A0A8K0SNJ7_9HYPO|nr:bola-like protein-domain-containing protein [Stachybotrys elegans]